MINADKSIQVLSHVHRVGLMSESEVGEVAELLSSDFLLAGVVGLASSLHVHIKVADVGNVPRQELIGQGGTVVGEIDGYIKFSFPSGLNVICSSIPIRQEDLLRPSEATNFPLMDHIGIDLRIETDQARSLFDGVPRVVREHGWRHVPQGGTGIPVYCCHTEVKGKHWVYPPLEGSRTRPIEIAFGELAVHAETMGCDLRPIDPVHPRARELVRRTGSTSGCG